MLDKSRDPSICHLSVYLIQVSITGKFLYTQYSHYGERKWFYVPASFPCCRSELLDKENKSRSRHNVEGSFLCVLYFGWPNQPSSGIMIILH